MLEILSKSYIYIKIMISVVDQWWEILDLRQIYDSFKWNINLVYLLNIFLQQ